MLMKFGIISNCCTMATCFDLFRRERYLVTILLDFVGAVSFHNFFCKIKLASQDRFIVLDLLFQRVIRSPFNNDVNFVQM